MKIDVTNPKEGVYFGLDHKEYSELPFVRKSYLFKLAQCPAKALVKDKDTPALIFGRAFHSYVLDGKAAFNSEYHVIEHIDKRTKEGKKEYQDALNIAQHKTIITTEDYLKIQAMEAAIRSHPSASVLLAEGVSEQTVIWQQKDTGIWCKCRPDHSTYGDQLTIVDIKKTRSADSHAFQRDVVRFGYDIQAGMYLDGVAKVTGKKYDSFCFIAVEDEEPYRTEVYALSREFVSRGKSEFLRLLRLEKECREKNFYPNYKHPGIDGMEIPGYLSNDEGIFEAMAEGGHEY